MFLGVVPFLDRVVDASSAFAALAGARDVELLSASRRFATVQAAGLAENVIPVS